ncbi:uncharacterized protein LOC122655289 [Telopea speciosissima]|uniref:uncharacterized protein LOC122655289 n=1 Tax=Telopea speciosissima TaxID=54955 RepID=UPI001CC7199C|nr:uncharacterized protein LOC122655289 [Telopea speciosissima]
MALTGPLDDFLMQQVIWWEKHGSSTPELTKLARYLLGLCCSSSDCERNWSIIETKKRNRLEHQRFNDRVYIQYNRRLQLRFQERKEQCRNYNPLVLDELDWSSEWMTGESDDELVPKDDLTWRTVSTVTKASSSFNGPNRPKRSGPSTSGAAPAIVSYSQCGRGRTEESSNEELELELEEDDVRDDENVEDDYGIESDSAGQQQEEEEEDLNILKWD